MSLQFAFAISFSRCILQSLISVISVSLEAIFFPFLLLLFLIISGCFFISLKKNSVWQDNIWGKIDGLTSQNVPIVFLLTTEHVVFTKDKWAEESDDQTEKKIPPYTPLSATEKDRKMLPRTSEHRCFWKPTGSSCKLPKLCMGNTKPTVLPLTEDETFRGQLCLESSTYHCQKVPAWLLHNSLQGGDATPS